MVGDEESPMKSSKSGGSGSSTDDPSVSPDPTEGTLGKDVQASLGMLLRRHYQKIVEEGVPDRFADLLLRYDQKVQPPASGLAQAPGAVENNDSDGKDPAA
jgi:hypothetical protein